MPPHRNQHSDIISDLSLTDSDRFGSASSFDPRDCSSLNGQSVAVRHLLRLHAQKNSGLKTSSSLTSRCSRRSKSFDSYDAEFLRRSLQSDELMSALTIPPPPPPPSRRSPNVQSKAAQENVERYKKLYDATLQDVLSVLKADDPPADSSPTDQGATAHAIAAHNDKTTCDAYVDNDAAVERFKEPPVVKRGLDPPPFMSDATLPPIITRRQSQDSLSDDSNSTVVIDCDESHDILSLLSDSNDGITEDVLFPPENKMRSSIRRKNNRQSRRDDGKKHRSKSGGDRRSRRQRRPSSASASRPKKRPDDEKKRHENMQRQTQPSRSKSPFARFVRGRSPSPTNDSRGAAEAASRSNKSPYNKLRSMSPFRRNRSSPTEQQNSGVPSSNNSSTGRRRSLSSSRERPGCRPSIAGSSSNANHTSTDSSSDELKKARLMKKMKTFASGLKHKLDESKKLLSSGSSSHKFKVGDMAEYRVGSRLCLEDLDYFIGEDGYTKMCVVRILEVGEDAVYEKPLYTILLPNGSKRQTNGNFMSPCSKQAAGESYRSRHQSAQKLKSRHRSSSRSSSKHRSRSRSSESHRSNSSRHSSKSTSSHRSSSQHHSRRSPSPHQHQSKARYKNHRNGSNGRSSSRSKQRNHTSSPNAKSASRKSMSRSNSLNCPQSPSYTDPIINSTMTDMRMSTSNVTETENQMNTTQRW